MVFSWFKFHERDRRARVRFDRKHLEARTRRFLKAYLAADETRKSNFYRAVEDASQKCHPAETDYELKDAQIAEATADAAMKVVSDRTEKDADHEDGRISAFITDSYATVAVAYHRAAGVYVDDAEMQELGTAAVHLLTHHRNIIRDREQGMMRRDSRCGSLTF